MLLLILLLVVTLVLMIFVILCMWNVALHFVHITEQWLLNFRDKVAHVIVHPEVKNWLKYARFEQKNQFISSARSIYERAVEYFGDENIDEKLLIAFAKFEEAQREVSVVVVCVVVGNILRLLK